MNAEPQRECPRWDRCSVNSCPLDPFQEEHHVHILDKEKKCPMEKSVRARIGSKYPDLLPRLGLTLNEHSAAQRWSKLSASERQAMADRGRVALSKLRPPNQDK